MTWWMMRVRGLSCLDLLPSAATQLSCTILFPHALKKQGLTQTIARLAQW